MINSMYDSSDAACATVIYCKQMYTASSYGIVKSISAPQYRKGQQWNNLRVTSDRMSE
jgi:hypothetical protein